MPIEETLCPKCKGRMKVVKGKNGPYWLCKKLGCGGTRDSMGMSREDRELTEDDGTNEVGFQYPRWDRK